MKLRLVIALLLAFFVVSAPAAEARIQKTKPVGWGPRTSKAAAKLVDRSKWEPRPQNTAYNHHRPTKKMLRAWRKQREMPYKKYVDGNYRGTTDEIIQWAAAKWGLNTNLMRAVATVESWWVMDTHGDNGDSFGLYQVRRPYHCFNDCDIAGKYTAFNADYYGGIIRSYLDGTQTWLNTVGGSGKRYKAGSLWGSIGAWYSGRWFPPGNAGLDQYWADIKMRRAEVTWHQPFFVGK